MYLHEVRIWNFRQIGSIHSDGQEDLPGLTVKFKKGLNVIVGENDAGKSTVIDAIRLVLWTQGREFFRVDYEDFHLPPGEEETKRAQDMRIECVIRDIGPHEGQHFLEWTQPPSSSSDSQHPELNIVLEASREQRKIYTDYYAGPSQRPINAKAREFLRVTYLKPLRDAGGELQPGRNSRLSQILGNHETFDEKDKHQLVQIMGKANSGIMGYFQGLDEDGQPLTDLGGKLVLDQINKYLREFSKAQHELVSRFSISDNTLKSILEKLGLQIVDDKAGLGSLNILFIATELLLLERDDYYGIKLGLIEELESHLHPQAQLRLVEYLQESVASDSTQLILTTHSPNLASKISVEHLIMFKNGKSFAMDASSTKLRKGDYLFLERFLDVTKANLFFAEGVILVEGDAENLLIPTLARIIGVPLSKYGVSIVNVGSTAFLRYSGIFKRSNPNENMGIPVACITDCDIKPDRPRSETIRAIERKQTLYDGQGVKTFVSSHWTLEYVLALSSFYEEFLRAVLYASKVQNSDDYGLTDEKRERVDEEVLKLVCNWNKEAYSKDDIAFYIYNDLVLGKSISKAIIAQCFAEILLEKDRSIIKEQLITDEMLMYLLNAIRYAAGIPIVEKNHDTYQ